MDEFIGKKVDAFRPINFLDLKVIPTLYVQRDCVHTFMHDNVYLEVYTSSIHVSRTDVKYVCVWWYNVGISTRCTSRLDSYTHTVYEMMNDDESLD